MRHGSANCADAVAPDAFLMIASNAGQRYCLIHRDWKGGIPMLTRREFVLVLLAVVAVTGLAAVGQTTKKALMNATAIEWNSVQDKTNATGSSRKFLDGPTATLDNLECHASTLKPGAMNHEILERPDDEVIIVKEGTIEAYVVDKWVRIGPGSVIFNARNVPQAIRNVGDGPATYHVVTFRVAGVPATTGGAEKK